VSTSDDLFLSRRMLFKVRAGSDGGAGVSSASAPGTADYARPVTARQEVGIAAITGFGTAGATGMNERARSRDHCMAYTDDGATEARSMRHGAVHGAH
jgi:hypothetical protein